MISIAMDGTFSSGKSSIARAVSKKLNILYLNSGELFRACGLYCLENNIDPNDKEKVVEAMKNVSLTIKYIDGKQHTYINDVDVSDKLHTPTMGVYSSIVAVYPEVREKTIDIQRSTAATQSVIIEGRDITSHVLPNADYKFFISASEKIRARRRYDEFKAKGEKVTMAQVMKDLKERDYRDSHRDVCPLVRTPDSIYITTTNLTLDQAVEKVLSYIKKR